MEEPLFHAIVNVILYSILKNTLKRKTKKKWCIIKGSKEEEEELDDKDEVGTTKWI